MPPKVTIVRPEELSSKSLLASDYVGKTPKKPKASDEKKNPRGRKKFRTRIVITVDHEGPVPKDVEAQLCSSINRCVANHELLQDKTGDLVVDSWNVVVHDSGWL